MLKKYFDMTKVAKITHNVLPSICIDILQQY